MILLSYQYKKIKFKPFNNLHIRYLSNINIVLFFELIMIAKISRKLLPLVLKFTFYLRIRAFGNLFGYEPLASKKEYNRLFQIAKNSKNSSIDKLERKLGFKIEKDWIDNDFHLNW